MANMNDPTIASTFAARYNGMGQRLQQIAGAILGRNRREVAKVSKEDVERVAGAIEGFIDTFDQAIEWARLACDAKGEDGMCQMIARELAVLLRLEVERGEVDCINGGRVRLYAEAGITNKGEGFQINTRYGSVFHVTVTQEA